MKVNMLILTFTNDIRDPKVYYSGKNNLRLRYIKQSVDVYAGEGHALG
jgi:hypothetical protein